jgi:hypothetical protein
MKSSALQQQGITTGLLINVLLTSQKSEEPRLGSERFSAKGREV